MGDISHHCDACGLDVADDDTLRPLPIGTYVHCNCGAIYRVAQSVGDDEKGLDFIQCAHGKRSEDPDDRHFWSCEECDEAFERIDHDGIISLDTDEYTENLEREP